MGRAYVNESFKTEARTELCSCVSLSCDYCRELTCSIDVEHESWGLFYSYITGVSKKKKKNKGKKLKAMRGVMVGKISDQGSVGK